MLHRTNRTTDLSNIELFDNNKWFAQVFVGGLLTILLFTVLMPLVTPSTMAGNTVVENTKK